MAPKFQWRALRDLVTATYVRWNEHDAPRLGASLAYYTLLSVAPLMILVVAICGIVFGKSTAEERILAQTGQVVGSGGALALKMVLTSARQPGTGVFASLVALITLLFGASGVFLELRKTLNTIWEVPPRNSSGWREMVGQRLVSFAMVLGLGFLLLTSLLLSAALAVIEHFATGLVPLPAALIGEALNVLVSLVTLAVLFALIYKFVPEIPIDWRDVVVGAAVTSLLFVFGKSLLAFYLSTAAVGSTYGAAGSLVALVVWVYYSAQIFFFGAVFTRIYAERFGSRYAKAGGVGRPEPFQNSNAAYFWLTTLK